MTGHIFVRWGIKLKQLFKKGQILELTEGHGLGAKAGARATVIKDTGENDRYVNVTWIQTEQKLEGDQRDGQYAPTYFKVVHTSWKEVLK